MAAPGMAELGVPDPQDQRDADYMLYLTVCSSLTRGGCPSFTLIVERLSKYEKMWSYLELHPERRKQKWQQ